jgi:YihY family inner membrane protein
MRVLSKPTQYILTHPVAFALQTLRSFSKNQGLLLAGAVAYYALLSVVPLLIVSVIALSHLVDQAELLSTLGRYLEWVVPSQSRAVLVDVSAFLQDRIAIGAVLLVTMLFFSSIAFSVLGKSMSIILADRETVNKRHFLVTAVIPYCFVLLLGIALLGVTLASVTLQAMAEESVQVLGWNWSLRGVSGLLLYVLGFTVETLILAALYLAMPVARIRLNHALVGGFTAALLWEILRHILIWYVATLSKASVVYGSLTTAVVVLLSMELAATVLLLGAQVIAEYRRLGQEFGAEVHQAGE